MPITEEQAGSTTAEMTPVESAPPEAPETKEAPPASPEQAASESEGVEQTEEEKAALKAYKPRDKFKVRVFGSEEQKEHDVPEWLKTTMKDEASEKQAIELLEKAHGLDTVKASRTAVARERDTFKTELSKIQSTISDVRQTYQRGDIEAFLEKLAIPQERMLQWALEKVNYSQLPPEQQKLHDDQRAAERRAWAAEAQSSTMEQQIQEQARQAKQVLLQSSLARPDVSTFAKSFDDQAGKPGAFFEQVRATGELAWIQSEGKIDLTPDQAVERVMKQWGSFVKPAQAPGTPPANVVAAPNTPEKKPAVIPNLQGRTTSPMKSGPRSLDDLRKLGKQAQHS